MSLLNSPVAQGGATTVALSDEVSKEDDVPVIESGYAFENARMVELGLTGYQRVKRLMTVMEQACPERPAWPDEATFRLRVSLDLEEFFEKIVLGYYLGDPVEIVDGACDVEVVGIGSMVAFGIDHDLTIAEVDGSNLSKLGEDGKPIKNDGIMFPDLPVGKFLKGPNYYKPELIPYLRGLETIPAPYDTAAITRQEFFKTMLKYISKHPDFFHDPKTHERFAYSLPFNPGSNKETSRANGEDGHVAV